MIGTHGSLQGKSSTTNKAKTHPAVEVKNLVVVEITKYKKRYF